MTGEAFTFVAPDEEGDLRAIERAVGKALPRVTVPDFDYAAQAPPRDSRCPSPSAWPSSARSGAKNGLAHGRRKRDANRAADNLVVDNRAEADRVVDGPVVDDPVAGDRAVAANALAISHTLAGRRSISMRSPITFDNCSLVNGFCRNACAAPSRPRRSTASSV